MSPEQEQPQQPLLALGLMSGTSADGVDAALLFTDGASRIEFLEATTVPYEKSLRRALIHAAQFDIPLVDVLDLEQQLTQVHVVACRSLLEQAQRDTRDVDVVGFHGHTIRHDGQRGITWQLGDASLLSTSLQARTVHDFRRADMALGGQGAPLAPLFHRQLLQNLETPAIVLNLGGVANITWVGPGGKLLAGDVGPGCGLLDAWIEKHTRKPFDEHGHLALKGRIDVDRVRSMLGHAYFQQPLPKSADRYEFGFVDVSDLGVEDGAATLCALTAGAVAAAVDRLPERPVHCWVTGGGSKHPLLMQLLSESLGHAETVAAIGWNADFLEAQCFGWLAVRRLRGFATSLPETTGCQRPACGGSITEPQPPQGLQV